MMTGGLSSPEGSDVPPSFFVEVAFSSLESPFSEGAGIDSSLILKEIFSVGPGEAFPFSSACRRPSLFLFFR